MPLSVVGINHRSAPVAIRERIAFGEIDMPAALDSLRQVPGVAEATIVSTCNRTEIYCQLYDGGEPLTHPTAWLLAQPQAQQVDLRPFLYQHDEDETVLFDR